MIYAIDCEWNRKRELLCFTYAYYDNNELITEILLDKLAVIDFMTSTQDDLWIGHNIKSDLLILMENVGLIHYNVFDTMIAAQQLSNGSKQTDVKGFYTYGNLVKRICGVDLDKSEQVKFLDKFDQDFSDSQLDYIKSDVKYLFLIYNKLIGLLNSKEMSGEPINGIPRCFEIDMQVLPVLAKIEAQGMLIDVPKWRLLVEQWILRSAKYLDEINIILNDLGYDTVIKTIVTKGRGTKKTEVLVETPVNFNSWQQIHKIFSHFDLPLPKDKYGKDSTNKDLLAAYNSQYPDNILKDFIRVFGNYKKTMKLISSFGEDLLNNLKDSKTLHTEYSIAYTATGRLSSSGNNIRPYTTNVQNIPAKSQDGKDIMSCIVAEEGHQIVCADMSGAELRIVGSLSKDQLLMDSFNKGVDFHSELASCSWEVICKENQSEYKPINKQNNPNWQDSDFRTVHKGVNFGIVYGATFSRVASVLQIPLAWGKQCKSAIDQKVPVLMRYLKQQQNDAAKNKCLISPFTGRIRHNLNQTEASNWQIQCANAEAMKIALIKLDRYIIDNNIDAKIINTVHDSVVISISSKHIANDEHLFIRDIMSSSLGLFLDGIKGESDLSISSFWKK